VCEQGRAWLVLSRAGSTVSAASWLVKMSGVVMSGLDGATVFGGQLACQSRQLVASGEISGYRWQNAGERSKVPWYVHRLPLPYMYRIPFLQI